MIADLVNGVIQPPQRFADPLPGHVCRQARGSLQGQPGMEQAAPGMEQAAQPALARKGFDANPPPTAQITPDGFRREDRPTSRPGQGRKPLPGVPRDCCAGRMRTGPKTKRGG